MKKSVVIILIILIIVITICISGIKLKTKTNKIILQQNKQYEMYLDHVIYGTDVITLINKAISNNELNNVSKDEKGFYLNNNQNSIIIDLVMITGNTEKEKTTYKMETIEKVGITEFVKNFNSATFECTKKEYHSKTGQIAYIEITQKN